MANEERVSGGIHHLLLIWYQARRTLGVYPAVPRAVKWSDWSWQHHEASCQEIRKIVETIEGILELSWPLYWMIWSRMNWL